MEGNPNNPLLAKINRFESAETTRANWEHARITHMLQVLRLPSVKSRLQRAEGNRTFSFEAFYAECPKFPMHLFFDNLPGSIPIHRDNKSVHPMWFKSFMSLPVVKLYKEKLSLCPWSGEDRPVGLVFPRKGFQQGLIVHNGSFDRFVSDGSGCHVYRQEGGSTLIVQAFTGFLSHLETFFEE